MKLQIKTVLIILAVVAAAVIFDRIFCMRDTDLEAEKRRTQNSIDSLNQVIQMREDSLASINQRIAFYEKNIDGLKEQIAENDRQIDYYKRSGRFEYASSTDSLHRELDRLVKRRLGEAVSTDSLFR